MMENKQEICNLLLKALQATRGGEDITALDYANDKEVGIEVVEIRYKNGHIRPIDVSFDTSIGLIRDIASGISD